VQIASAIALSLLEWLIKTFDCIRGQRRVVAGLVAEGESREFLEFRS
jgi:hypothetical protein